MRRQAEPQKARKSQEGQGQARSRLRLLLLVVASLGLPSPNIGRFDDCHRVQSKEAREDRPWL